MASISPYKHFRVDGTPVERYRVRFQKPDGTTVSKSFESKSDAEEFVRLNAPEKKAALARIITQAVDQAIAEHEKFKRERPDWMREDGTPKTSAADAVARFIKSRTEGLNGSPPAAPETVRNYKRWLEHFATFFAGRYAEDITRADARAFRAYCDDPQLGARAMIGIYSTTITMWNFLMGLDIVESNVFYDATKGLKLKTKSRQAAVQAMNKDCYTYDEAYAIWQFADLLVTNSPLTLASRKTGWRTSAMIKLMIATGMRRSELCGVKFDAFDYARRQLTIRSTVLGEGRESTVKSANSARTLKLHPDVADAIQDWIDNRRPQYLTTDKDKSPFIFCDKDGSPLAGNAWYITFLRTMAVAKIKPKTMHAFRHMVTSVLVDCGVDDLRIIRTLGHDNVGFSRSHYGHLMPHDGDEKAREFIQERCVATAGLTLEKLKMLAA